MNFWSPEHSQRKLNNSGWLVPFLAHCIQGERGGDLWVPGFNTGPSLGSMIVAPCVTSGPAYGISESVKKRQSGTGLLSQNWEQYEKYESGWRVNIYLGQEQEKGRQDLEDFPEPKPAGSDFLLYFP